MKIVKFHKGEAFNSKQSFTEVLSLPAQGCSVADMRRRMKVLDKLETAVDEVELEDAEFELLKQIYHGTQFRVVHKDLLAIADTLS